MNEFIYISDYMHGYRIQGLHDNLIQYKEIMIEQYKNFPPHSNAANIMFQNIEFQKTYNNLLLNIVNQNYLVDQNWIDGKFGIFLQDDTTRLLERHNHIKTHTLNAVFYIDPPSPGEGGDLEYWGNLDFNTLHPEKDVIYFFPAWMIHRPLPQISKIPRIAINWGYRCTQRPIHKITGTVW
tara:strand:- start:81 stop:623 length:543 start_codon:yes stop_codon:yes gene_type:complete